MGARIDPVAVPAAGLAEARGFLRIDGTSEDARLTPALAAAVALCEAFTGQVMLVRGVHETMPRGETASDAGWRRLALTPVRSIDAVRRPGGVLLGPDDHAVDIDADGDGWVRMARASWGAAERFEVVYQAGMSLDWAGVPEALRQGIVRLAGHFHAPREDAAGEAVGTSACPPAAVAALWRPYRRMRLR